MTTKELLTYMQNDTILSWDELNAIITSFENCIVNLKENESVNLQNFGSFTKKYVKSRIGRNPKTGESINIDEHYKIKFNPSKKFVMEL